VLRSVDAGLTWSGPYTVSDWRSMGVRDPADGHAVCSGEVVPAVAVDLSAGPRGWLYAAW